MHALDVIHCLGEETDDIKTVVSEEISLFDIEPSSTNGSNKEDDQYLSDIEDI